MNQTMITLANERTNEYFQKLNHLRVDIAFEIKKYLDPDTDEVQKAGKILDLFHLEDFEAAISFIFEDLRISLGAYWSEELKNEAISFAKLIYKRYTKSLISESDRRRKYLLEELAKLDKGK
jgi:hypothetical protein